MATWTDIPNGDVDPGSPLSTALMTALRDNVVALAEQAAGSPFVDTPYDIQVFPATGTWTKPASALSGERVVVFLFGAGGGGCALNTSGSIGDSFGGGGGGGLVYAFAEMDEIAATAAVTIGAGGSGGTQSGNGNNGGANGGDSIFSSAGTLVLTAAGGGGGSTIASGGDGGPVSLLKGGRSQTIPAHLGGIGSDSADSRDAVGPYSYFGGGAGGIADASAAPQNIGPTVSELAGDGGSEDVGSGDRTGGDGNFPSGGGGAASSSTSTATSSGGDGSDGFGMVVCYRKAGA